jgi:hypothetical protein
LPLNITPLMTSIHPGRVPWYIGSLRGLGWTVSRAMYGPVTRRRQPCLRWP